MAFEITQTNDNKMTRSDDISAASSEDSSSAVHRETWSTDEPKPARRSLSNLSTSGAVFRRRPQISPNGKEQDELLKSQWKQLSMLRRQEGAARERPCLSVGGR